MVEAPGLLFQKVAISTKYLKDCLIEIEYKKRQDYLLIILVKKNANIQGVIESCTDILTTSYWFHVELGKNI
jgi:hypothetical protein